MSKMNSEINDKTRLLSSSLSLIIVFFIFLTGTANAVDKSDRKILFVGNSMLYVGNMPAVFNALAASNGHKIQPYQILEGGATLTERLTDRSIQSALENHKFTYVIFQERGGDIMCVFGPDSCQNSLTSIKRIARFAKRNKSKPLFLGSYQPNPDVSKDLVAEEASIAKKAKVIFVSVSDYLQEGLKQIPEGLWLHSDRAHPGNDLVLLQAMLVYIEIFKEYPAENELRVYAPIFGPKARFKPLLQECKCNKSNVEEEDFGRVYNQEKMSSLVQLVRKIKGPLPLNQ